MDGWMKLLTPLLSLVVLGQSPPRYRPQTSFKDPITWQNDTYFQVSTHTHSYT